MTAPAITLAKQAPRREAEEPPAPPPAPQCPADALGELAEMLLADPPRD